MDRFKDFLTDESGAVTVDWVVLSAAIVGLGVAVVASISQGTGSVGAAVGGQLGAAQVTKLEFPKFY